MEFTWQVTFIGEVEKVEALDNKPKQTVTLLEVGKEYPNGIAVDFRGDKTMQLATYKLGDIVKVLINSKTREDKKNPGRFYTSLTAWKIGKAEAKKDSENLLPF